MVDAQIRGPDRPGCGTAEEVAAFQAKQLADAMEALAPVLKDPRGALLAGEVKWRLGDAQASAEFFGQAGDDAIAQFGLARALAALGKTRQAAKPAGMAASAEPGSPPAAQLAAGIAILRQEADAAVGYLQVVHRQDPLDPVTLTLLALAHRAAGNAAQAVALEQQVNELQAQTDEPADIPGALQDLGLAVLTRSRDSHP